MKSFARLGLLGSGLGLMFLTATPSFATVVGELFTGGSGSVTVTATGITFTANDSKPGASTEVGANSTLTFAGGTIATGDPISINGGMAITGFPVANFMTFSTAPNLSFTLDGFTPGSSNTNCSGLSTGESCSPLIGGVPSPVILTYTGPGVEGATPFNVGTSAELGVMGTAMDGGSVVSSFFGTFTAPFTKDTPASLDSLFNSTGSITATTYAGNFVVTSPVPEPRTISMIVIAGLLMGLVVARRKNSVA